MNLKNQIKYLTLFSLLASSQFNVHSQNDDKLVQYVEGFNFKEGLYIHFMDWKANDPITLDKIITNYDKDDKLFFRDLLSGKKIKYYDKNGVIQEVKPAEIFGYSVDNFVYTYEHTKISVIGAICHFSNITMGTITEQHVSHVLLSKEPGKDQIKEFIIDFEGNRKLYFNKKNVENILKRDAQLFKEYKNTKGKKKEKLYQFMFKYNKKYPIYFPR